MTDYVDPSGIRIPEAAVGLLVDASSIVPNSWNPNKMDSFMREKLVISMQKDGFTTPIMVRNYKGAGPGKYEIIDGEHRWRVAAEDLGAKKLPIMNLGDVSDENAKKLTIKANSLRGEFDAVGLAELVKQLADAEGINVIIEELPFTGDRLNAMIELLNVDVGSTLGLRPDGSLEPAKKTGEGDDFKAFDPTTMAFDHNCPRCGFQFNDKK